MALPRLDIPIKKLQKVDKITVLKLLGFLDLLRWQLGHLIDLRGLGDHEPLQPEVGSLGGSSCAHQAILLILISQCVGTCSDPGTRMAHHVQLFSVKKVPKVPDKGGPNT